MGLPGVISPGKLIGDPISPHLQLVFGPTLYIRQIQSHQVELTTKSSGDRISLNFRLATATVWREGKDWGSAAENAQGLTPLYTEIVRYSWWDYHKYCQVEVMETKSRENIIQHGMSG